MAVFEYKALKDRVRRSGKVEAADQKAALAKLRTDGFAVLEINAFSGSGKADFVRDGRSDIEMKVASLLIFKSQMEITLRQLASVLTAGVPILTALNSVSRQAPYFLKRMYACVAEKVRKGYSLKHCLNEEAPFLGNVTIGLIAVGEANGTLDEMLDYSAELMERARKVRSQIIQAFFYPSIVVVGAFGVGYFMVAKVFPKIMGFIEKQGKQVKLPAPTRILIQVNDFLSIYGLYVLLVPVVLVIAFVLVRRNRVTGRYVDRAMLSVPLLGKAIRDHANTMWCRTFGALLSSGVDVLSAIDLVSSTMGNQYYSLQFKKMRNIVRQGGSITRGLEATQLSSLCPMSLTMVSVSEDIGGLDESLLHVARYSEEQLSRRVALMSKLVEPAIFIVVGGMVGFIYFAFFMAMLAVTRSAR